MKKFFLFCLLAAVSVLTGAEYIHNGKFLDIDYAPEVQRAKLQPYWTMTPNSYSAFKLVKDVEADSVNSHVKVLCPRPPKVTYKRLNLISELVSLPDQAAKVSFRARGDGQVAAYVFEYLRTGGKQQFLRRAATFNFVKLEKDWKVYTFDYMPGKGERGKALLYFNFKPAKGDALNLDITDVSVQAPEVKREAIPAKMVIPKLTKAPVIDGKVDENEWKGALLLSGFKQIDGYAPAPNTSHMRIAYDDEYIYFGFTVISGDKPYSKFTTRDSALYREDSIETVFSDMDDNKYAQIIVSSQAALFDTNKRRGNPGEWNIDIKAASSSNDMGWSAEMAVPRKELSVPTVEGQPFKLNFFQYDQIKNENFERIIYSVWAQSARNNKSIPVNNVDFPIAVLAADKISASVETAENGALQLHVNNPGAAQTLYCEYGSDSAHYGTKIFKVPSGISKHPVDFAPQNELAVVKVRDAAGNEIYSNAEIFKYKLETHLGIKKYLPRKYVELTSTISTLNEYRLNWSLGNISKGEFKVKKGVNAPMNISVEKLEANKVYPLVVRILDNAGNSMGERTFDIMLPPKEPWADCQLGITDEPLPPFKAVKAEGDALEFLMQRYEYNNRALPASVKSENIELLAAPVSFKLNGKDLADNVTRKVTSKKPNRVEWQGENAAARWSGWAEEDGFAWYTVTIKANPAQTAETLYLDIPVKKEFASVLSPVPFFRSGGDMDGRYCYDFKPWVSMDFKQIVTLRSEDRGIELVAEDARGFSRKEKSGYHRLIPQKDRVIIRMTIIDKPVKLDKDRTYSFGIQAFPAKPFVLKEGTLAHADYVDPRTAAWSGGGNKAIIRNSLPGKPRFGTIEFNAYWDFDPNFVHPDYHVREFFTQTLFSYGNYGLRWNASEGGFLFRVGKKTLKNNGAAPKISKGYHNLALTKEKNTVKIYVDKVKVAEFTDPGIGKQFNDVTFGKGEMRQHADFHYLSLKYTNRVLKPEEFGNGKSYRETVFHQNYRTSSKANYKVDGTLRKVKTPHGELYSASGEFFTRLDAAEYVGIKNMLGYLNRIFQFYGPKPWGYRCLPYTNDEGYKAYGMLLEDMKKRGMQIYFGWSFGHRVNSHEDKFYRDYYSIQPGRLYGNDISGFYCSCAGCLDYNNNLLYYFNDLMNRYDNLNIYTDNLFICGRECRNQAHGCGYIDENGMLQMSGNMLNGRRFAKRLYAITKARPIPREHYMHSSGCNHAMYMSWADKYLCGEQYLENTTMKGWNIDLGQYRAQNVASCFGVPAISISTFVPFGMRGMIAVAALHNCGTSGASHHKYPNDLLIYKDFVKSTGDFGSHTAEFLPYYKNSDVVVTAQDKREYASCWKKPGKVLVVVSNLKWQDAKVKVQFNFAKLGVKGKVRNAVTNEAIAVDAQGNLTLDIQQYDAKYLLVE